MITKDGRDTPIEKLTPEIYIVPKGEERFYHAVIEVVQFDPKTGKRLSKPRVQKFGKKSFEGSVQASLRKQGYTITILHDPNQWIAEQQAKAAAAEKADAEAKAKAEQEKFDAAVAAAVAKALAERDEKEKAAAAEKAAAEKADAGKEDAAKAEADQQAAKEPANDAPAAEQAKKPGRPAKTDKE